MPKKKKCSLGGISGSGVALKAGTMTLIDVDSLVKFLILEYTKTLRGLRVETQQMGFRRKYLNAINIRLRYNV